MNRTHRLLSMLLLSATVTLGACGNGTLNDGVGTDPQNDIPVLPSTNPPATDSPGNVPVTDGSDNSGTDSGTPDQPAEPVIDPLERTPGELLLLEIKSAAADPILMLNQKLGSGEFLSPDEQNCLGNYAMAVGDPVSAIDCIGTVALGAYDSRLTVQQAELVLDTGCQQALFAGHADGCSLDRARLTVLQAWDTTSGHRPTPIPGSGVSVDYNVDGSGLLEFGGLGDLTGAFQCALSLSDASLLLLDSTIGNCQTRLADLLRYLTAIRTGQD